jgi:tRNA (guanine37-N1)-methyltransferase
MTRIDVFTLFPQAFDWFAGQVHLRRAADLGLELRFWDYRRYTTLSGGQVDDAPYGGGAGMVLRIDVVCAALEGALGGDCTRLRDDRRVVELTPRGRQLDDALAGELAADDLVLLCGRYEGIDERVARIATDRVSIGPYVLSGGEIAAMALLDAVVRKIEGAVSNPESVVSESFAPDLGGAGEYPHFTRPAEYRGWGVPDVLLSGDHGRIADWRSRHTGPAVAEAAAGRRSRDPA